MIRRLIERWNEYRTVPEGQHRIVPYGSSHFDVQVFRSGGWEYASGFSFSSEREAEEYVRERLEERQKAAEALLIEKERRESIPPRYVPPFLHLEEE